MRKYIFIGLLLIFSTQSIEAVSRVDYEEQLREQQAQQEQQSVSKSGSLIGLIPCTAYRDESDPSRTPSGLNCNKWQEIVDVIRFFIEKAFVIATVLATISFLYAGWIYLTSRGEPAKLQKAHGIFWNVIKGFIFMAVAYLIVNTILKTIAVQDYSLLEY